MKISILVAVADHGVIGRRGELPWRLSADLVRFKQLTWGHWIVMGRKTFDSIGRVLPGRTSVVITRQSDFHAPEGVVIAHSFDDAVAKAAAASESEVFVVGGGEIYRQAITRADQIFLTKVHAQIQGDAFFPEFQEQDWTLVDQQHCEADEKNEYASDYLVYRRAASETSRD